MSFNSKVDEFNFANDDTIYDKYLEDLKKYYILKNKNNKIKETFKNKLLNSNDSIEVKKKLYAKKKFNCINCKQEGGTIFLENNDGMMATCGNIEKPCNLKLSVAKTFTKNIHSMITDYTIKINNLKKEIYIIKINFLFNYISEDDAVEFFENKNTELKILQESYNKLLLLNDSIKNNEDTKNLINTKYIEQNNYIEEYKQFIKIFRDSHDKKILNNALNIYKTKILEVNKILMDLKYKVNFVEKEDEFNTLIQKKYSQNQLEILLKK